jgi:hypothetical protein
MSIRIPVDLKNPGQFFACCGLLELANRLWPNDDVQGTFSANHFQIFANTATYSLKHLMEQFVNAEVCQLDVGDKAASPLFLGNPFAIRLDWWRKVETGEKRRVDIGGGEQLKTWAGKQFGPLIFRLMKSACLDIDLEAPLDETRAVCDIKSGKLKEKTLSPFYFDARREATCLDIGFSPDEQGMSVMAYPAVESLALVGLQRFRPMTEEGELRTFLYTPWSDALPPVIAMAAASGMVPVRSCGTFRFSKPSRGGDYLTMFSKASRERSIND